MLITWNEIKRRSNLRDHGLDFLDCAKVFAGLTFTFEDDRFVYDECRYVTLGLLNDTPVSIVHTEVSARIRIIFFRKATRNEEKIYFESLKN